jgi:hypothetical protein
MGSRQMTGGEDARLPEVSRRLLVVGAPAATVVALRAPATGTASPDERTRQLRRWLSLTKHIERLQNRWARLEGWLVREHDWLRLNPAEQQALPWAQELRDIDGCLDALFERRERLLATLPTSGVASLDSAIIRLAVVQRLIWPDDHPEAHALVADVRRDLIAMSGRAGAL